MWFKIFILYEKKSWLHCIMTCTDPTLVTLDRDKYANTDDGGSQ